MHGETVKFKLTTSTV